MENGKYTHFWWGLLMIPVFSNVNTSNAETNAVCVCFCVFVFMCAILLSKLNWIELNWNWNGWVLSTGSHIEKLFQSSSPFFLIFCCCLCRLAVENAKPTINKHNEAMNLCKYLQEKWSLKSAIENLIENETDGRKDSHSMRTRRKYLWIKKECINSNAAFSLFTFSCASIRVGLNAIQKLGKSFVTTSTCTRIIAYRTNITKKQTTNEHTSNRIRIKCNRFIIFVRGFFLAGVVFIQFAFFSIRTVGSVPKLMWKFFVILRGLVSHSLSFSVYFHLQVFSVVAVPASPFHQLPMDRAMKKREKN